MPEIINVHVKSVMRGPTLTINLITTGSSDCHYIRSFTTERFLVEDLVNVVFQVKNDRNYHTISMFASKYERAKCDVIGINVTCHALSYSKKGSHTDFASWTRIGIIDSPVTITNATVNLSQIEIVIHAYGKPKPAFPKLFDECGSTDFTLSTTDGDVAVHKACLAMHSPVFEAMFTGTWKEAEENKVEIKGYYLQTIQHLKNFLYLGTLPDVGLRPLIALAAFYSMNDLKKQCARKLAETVQPEELYSLHEFACANNIPELSCAITLLTPGYVVDQWHKIQKEEENKTE